MQDAGAMRGAQMPPMEALEPRSGGPISPRARLAGLTAGQWAMALAVALMIAPVWGAMSRGPTIFDDSYMFWRYAMHLQQGLGLAWNPDGIQTYGLTSHLWLLAVLPFTWLPIHPGYALPVASTLAAALGLAVMGAAVARQAKSDILRDRTLATALIALPLLANPFFTFHLSTGMDTMLSMAAHAAILLWVLAYLEAPSARRACIVGVLAFAAVLTRPENGLCALGVPFLAFIWNRRWDRWRDLAGLAVLPVALIGLELVVCWLVFGVPLPLSFYAKSLHIYTGFQNPENAVQNLFMAVAMAAPFIAVALAAGKRRDLALLAMLLLPVLLTFAYLLTMRQVMGWIGRYYLPFLPYMVIPAMLMLDRRLAVATSLRTELKRIGMALAAVAAVAAITWPMQRALEAAYIRAVMAKPVPPPPLPSVATDNLPKKVWFDVIQQVADEIVAPLPATAVLAASEVGYLGAASTGKTLIDLVGLNDTTIGRQGFSMDYLLSRKPDLIWMPSRDYTGLIATIYSDPRLYERYIVIREAFNYGIAIRRDSPYREHLEASSRRAWNALYPDRRFDDYVVRR
jgi:hypothetical protein